MQYINDMRKPTPEEQASWPEPNFKNPQRLQAPVIGATVIAFTLAVLCKRNGLLTALDQEQKKSRINRLREESDHDIQSSLHELSGRGSFDSH